MSKSNREIHDHAVASGWVDGSGQPLQPRQLYDWAYAHSVSAPEIDSAFGWQQTTTHRWTVENGLLPLTGDTPPPAPPPRPEIVRAPVREHVPAPKPEVIRSTLFGHGLVNEHGLPLRGMRPIYDMGCDYGISREIDAALGWIEGRLDNWAAAERLNPIMVQYEVMRQGYRPLTWEPLRLIYPAAVNVAPTPPTAEELRAAAREKFLDALRVGRWALPDGALGIAYIARSQGVTLVDIGEWIGEDARQPIADAAAAAGIEL